MTKKVSKKLKTVGLLLLLMAALGAVLALRTRSLVGSKITDARAEKLAQEVIKKCQGESYRPICYDEEVPKLMSSISMEDAFLVTKHIQNKDSSLDNCHILAKKLSFEEAKRRPTDWKEIIPRCPMNMCNYGCLHGAMIQHFRGEVLTDTQIEEAIVDLKDVCEIKETYGRTDLDQTMCYHALGHLAMYITWGDPAKSIDICEKVSKKEDGRDYHEICVEGAFMTVFQGVDEEDLALVRDIKPEKEGVRQFCSAYEGVNYEACNRESYPLFREDMADPAKLVEFCSYVMGGHGIWKCYATGMGDVVVSMGINDEVVGKVASYCKRLPQSRVSQCFANVAVRLVQIDPKYQNYAVSLCEEAGRLGLEAECYRDMINFGEVAFNADSQERNSYCQSLGEKWHKRCLEGER